MKLKVSERMSRADVDCAALPNVDEVRCEKGACVIGEFNASFSWSIAHSSDSCLRGFSLIDDACVAATFFAVQ